MTELIISILYFIKISLGFCLIIKVLRDYRKDKIQPDMLTAIAIIVCMQ